MAVLRTRSQGRRSLFDLRCLAREPSRATPRVVNMDAAHSRRRCRNPCETLRGIEILRRAPVAAFAWPAVALQWASGILDTVCNNASASRIGNSIGVGRVFGEHTARSPTTRGPAGAQRPARRPPPHLGRSRWMSGGCFPWAPGRRGDRSDASVGRTRTPNVPVRDRDVGVRLRKSGGPRRVVAWRPGQTVLGSREDSARRRVPPSQRGRGGARGSGRSRTVA